MRHFLKHITASLLIAAKQPTDIIAYMSLVVCEVLPEDIPHQWKNKYPKRIPGAKLAKLAVAHHQQTKGYGEVLLIEVMQKKT